MLRMMVRIGVFNLKYIGAGFKLTLLVHTDFQIMYFFPLALFLFHLLCKWFIIYGENKVFEILLIYCFLRRHFFQVTKYAGGILSRRHFFQEAFFLGGTFPGGVLSAHRLSNIPHSVIFCIYYQFVTIVNTYEKPTG